MTKFVVYRKSWFIGTLKISETRFFKDINIQHMHIKILRRKCNWGSYSSSNKKYLIFLKKLSSKWKVPHLKVNLMSFQNIYFYRKKFTEKSSKKFVFCLYFKTYCNNFLISVCVFISDLGAPCNKTVGALCYTTTIWTSMTK